MAVMYICCGCFGVRSGSIASAIYSLVIAILGLILFTFGLLGSAEYKKDLHLKQLEYPDTLGDLDVDSYVCALNAEYVFACISQGLVFIASILCIVGINQDNKMLLVPFMAAKLLGFVWYLLAITTTSYAMAKTGIDGLRDPGVGVIAAIPVLVPLIISDITIILCVLSQYQEYRDGRGRLVDQPGTTVIVHQTMPVGVGGFAYNRMQDPPPA